RLARCVFAWAGRDRWARPGGLLVGSDTATWRARRWMDKEADASIRAGDVRRPTATRPDTGPAGFRPLGVRESAALVPARSDPLGSSGRSRTRVAPAGRRQPRGTPDPCPIHARSL